MKNIILRNGVVVAALLIIMWLLTPTNGARTARRVDQAILKLPVGATKADVAALIHEEGLDGTSAYERIDKSFMGDSFVDESGYKPSQLSGFYGVRVPHTSRALIGECFTMYHFFFDKKGKLLKSQLESGCIGL